MEATEAPLMPEDANWDASGDTGEGWDAEGNFQYEVNSIHAQHVTAVTSQATNAAWHADVAAKQAASLAQWVNYLWGQVVGLQAKVTELEEWKKKTLEEMNRLRMAHKLIKKQVNPDGAAADEESLPPVPKAKSLPLMLNEHVDPESNGHPASTRRTQKAITASGFGPPPGLGLEEPPKKAVSFNSERAESAKGINSKASLSSMSLPSSESSATLDEGSFEGVHVEKTQLNGVEWERAEWRIGSLPSKLKNCMGRALVSSPFVAWGLEDLRLMIFPDGKEIIKGPRSKRQKEQYAKMVTEGPLEGCLKLKVPDCPPPHILEFYLNIGSVRKGPFRHNFQDSTVNGCNDFGVDWLQHLEADSSLKVTADILQVKE